MFKKQVPYIEGLQFILLQEKYFAKPKMGKVADHVNTGLYLVKWSEIFDFIFKDYL